VPACKPTPTSPSWRRRKFPPNHLQPCPRRNSLATPQRSGGSRKRVPGGGIGVDFFKKGEEVEDRRPPLKNPLREGRSPTPDPRP
jgi:hypothetical protein